MDKKFEVAVPLDIMYDVKQELNDYYIKLIFVCRWMHVTMP
jgi:hypothetical protein